MPNVFDKQDFSDSHLDYKILEKHIRFFDQLDVVGNSAISIFDLFRQEHVYLSAKFESTFGFQIERAKKEGNAYFNKRMFKEDIIKAEAIGSHFMKFAYTLDPEERKNYKLINEYRMTTGMDKEIRVIEQFQALELDEKGNVWLALCVMDISPDQDLDSPLKSRLINFKTGELFYFEPVEKTGKPKLSSREREVLNLIAKGFASKQIADELYISVHTVNTHRQKIIGKLEVSNTTEAVKYASDLGLL